MRLILGILIFGGVVAVALIIVGVMESPRSLQQEGADQGEEHPVAGN
jgi:hypothetical protein